MDREKAYEMAFEMFRYEGERWAKNALGLMAAIAAIFVAFAVLETDGLRVNAGWPFLLAAAVSGAAILITLSIRRTTDAWKETIKQIENSPKTADIKLYDLFRNKLAESRDASLSVTRVFTILFVVAFLAFFSLRFGCSSNYDCSRCIMGKRS